MSMQDLKKMQESFLRDWEEYKKTNDTKLENLEKNLGAADEKEKLAKMDKALDSTNKTIEKLQAAMNRTKGSDNVDVDKVDVEYKDAFNKLMKKGEKSLTEREVKALSVNSDPDGGYYVRSEVAAETQRKLFETSPMRQFASVDTIGSDALEIFYENDEAGAEWVGEDQSRSETSTPTTNKIVIPAHELSALPKATQKLLDDSSINIEQWLQGKVTSKFSRKENDAFINGDGNLKPRGILSYAAGDGFNKIEQINSGSGGAVTGNGLIDLQMALFEDFQPGAAFMMKRETFQEVRKLKDSNGNYLVGFAEQLNAELRMTLLGKPVAFAADMPAIAANSLSIAYGNFSEGYQIVDRVGIRVLRDPFTSKPFVKFYTTKRVGGGVKQFQAIKLQKLSA